jgi:hypothetical protein
MRRLLLVAIVGAAFAGLATAEEDLLALAREYESLLTDRTEPGYGRKEEILDGIADLASPAARRVLDSLLERYGAADRRGASQILAASVRRGGPREVDAAIAWVESRRDALLLGMLSRILAAAREPDARAHLRGDGLARAAPPVKAQAARALGLLRDAEAVAPLLLLLKEPDPRVKSEAMEALGAIADPRGVLPLSVFLRDEDWRLRATAARALGAIRDPRALAPLLRAIEGDPTAIVVESAAAALALLDRPEAIPAVLARLESAGTDDMRLSDVLARALRSLSGRDFGTEAAAWRAWWEDAKTRPFQKAPPDPGGTTVPGLRYYDFPLRSSRVVFLLDASRSMGWNGRLDAAKAELIRVIESLPRETRFNLVTYSDAAVRWAPRLQEAKPSVVRRAAEFVDRVQPDNGTNSWAGLLAALGDEEADTVFFLSDGHPSVGDVVDPELILAEVRSLNRWRRVRIHAVALLLGDPPPMFAGRENPDLAVEFMRRLAAENDGEFKVVR